jgi:multicomponent Na+:H+ antiporter subunit F
VSSFVIAAAAMAVALVPCLVVLMRGDAMAAVVAYQAISSVTIMVLILLAEGFRRTGEFELPVLGAVLLLGSGLVFVRFLERGL